MGNRIFQLSKQPTPSKYNVVVYSCIHLLNVTFEREFVIFSVNNFTKLSKGAWYNVPLTIGFEYSQILTRHRASTS